MRTRPHALLLSALLAIGTLIATPVPAGGASAPATAAAPTVLYGVDTAGSTVKRFTGTSTGAFSSTTIGRNLTAVRSIAADPAGNVTVLTNGSLVRLTAGGSQRAIATNLTGLVAMVVDGRGTVYVADRRRVIRVYQPSGAQTVMGTSPTDIEALGVDGSGRATAAYGNASAQLELRTFPSTPGAAPVVRTIEQIGDEGFNVYPLLETANGTIFVQSLAIGGSGAEFVSRINPGSSNAVDQNTRLADYAWTVDPRNRLHLMQTRKWCFTPDFTCVENRTVDHVLIFPDAGGLPRLIPVSALQLPPGGIAVSADQTTYAAAGSALVRIPAAGGAAQPLVTGGFTLLTIRPGS